MRPSGPAAHHAPLQERAAIVGLAFSGRRRERVEESLEELDGLTLAAGATVCLRWVQERSKPDPAFFLGHGKAQSLGVACADAEIDVAIFDDELTPGQLRNLEQLLRCRVIDRTQLILNIFASRAHTREGKLQVELAQLQYLMPRLTGAGVALSRLGAGIGTRGPGETKLESDRRRIRQRISRIARDLDAVRRRRARSRDRRKRGAVPTAALVGYTNAGKTSLFNVLTGNASGASKALFATLDPLVRSVRLPDRRVVLLSDTVGFIERLPHTLVAAFRATFEAVSDADLLLHVVDVSHPNRGDQIAAVRRVLEEVGGDTVPRLVVLNKVDRIGEFERRRLERRYPESILVSARTGTGRAMLVNAITASLDMDVQRVALEFDETADGDRRRLAHVYRYGRVLSHVRRGQRVLVEAELPGRMLARWRGCWVRLAQDDCREASTS